LISNFVIHFAEMTSPRPFSKRFKTPNSLGRGPLFRLVGIAVVAVFAVTTTGCASYAGHKFSKLDRENPKYQSESCQKAVRAIEFHDDVKIVRTVVSPIALLLSAGTLLPAVFAANVGLDTADRVDASRMEVHCGGKGYTPGEIATGVAKGAAFGLATNAAGDVVNTGALFPTSTASSR
jgi:hypothetical protein